MDSGGDSGGQRWTVVMETVVDSGDGDSGGQW